METQRATVKQSELFKLRRLDIKNDQWGKAVNALRDAIRVVGSKVFVRFHKRKSLPDKWEPITIDLAKP